MTSYLTSIPSFGWSQAFLFTHPLFKRGKARELEKEEEGEEKTCRETKLLRKAYSSLQWSFCSCKRHGILCLLKSLQVSMESLEISLKFVV